METHFIKRFVPSNSSRTQLAYHPPIHPFRQLHHSNNNNVSIEEMLHHHSDNIANCIFAKQQVIGILREWLQYSSYRNNFRKSSS